MNRIVLAASLAATAVITMALTAPQAEARGRGFGGKVAFVGGGFHRHRGYYAPVIYSTYAECRWFRTPYGPVKRCYY